MGSYRVFTLTKAGSKVYIGYAEDEDAMHHFALNHNIEYSGIVAGRHCSNEKEAEKEVEKLVGRFYRNRSDLPKYNRTVFVGAKRRIAWCYLCGKRESFTTELIEGEHGYVCSSCMTGMITSIIDQSGPEYFQRRVLAASGREALEASITFQPEFRQSGISILHYFAEVLAEKHPDEDVLVKIEQQGSIVRLTVQTPKGAIETVERELERYVMVVKGETSPASLGLSERGTLALEHELKLAQFRIESQRDIMLLQAGQIEKQSSQIEQLLELVGASVTAERGRNLSVTVSPAITMSPYQPTTATQEVVSRIDLSYEAKLQQRLFEVQKVYADDEAIATTIRAIDALIAGKGTLADVEHSLPALHSSPVRARNCLNRILDLGQSVIVGAAGSGLWQLLHGVLQTLVP